MSSWNSYRAPVWLLTMYPMLGSRIGVIRFQEVAELCHSQGLLLVRLTPGFPQLAHSTGLFCWLEMDAMAPLRHSATRHQPREFGEQIGLIEILLPSEALPVLGQLARRVPEFASPLEAMDRFRASVPWSNANLYAGEDAKDPGFCMRVFN